VKINPPKAIIGKEDPFEHTLFGRKEFAESLTSLLRNVEENLVIFVNAPWGEGKTTFSEMWRAQLKQRDLDVIYFDAYAADYFDDPFVAFSGEIIEFADKHLPGGKELSERREFKETSVEVGKRIAGLAVKIGLRAATLNAVDSTHVEEFKEIAAGISEVGADVIEKKIENFGVEKDALIKFKVSLAKLAAKVREKQKFPLTIIVDELDRCRPDFALSLLERIKHLFDVEGVAFVLLVNRKQIENYIRTVYGGSDAESYLLKFGSLFIDLPNHAPEDRHENGRKEYCQTLASHYGFPQQVDSHFLAKSIGVFANHFDLTLHEIEKVFATVAIYYGSSTPSRYSNKFENEWQMALLANLKIKLPSFYALLMVGKISSTKFYQETNLNQLKLGHEHSFSWDWMKAHLDYYLMTDDEIKTATENANASNGDLRQISRDMRGDRAKIIPFFCSNLNRFSLKP
jgi:hypothetical protein